MAADVVHYTQTDAVIGTLTNGMKVVSTTVTFTNADTAVATTVYVKPLVRIIGFLSAGNKKPIASAFNVWAKHATIVNAVTVTPTATTDTGITEIISFGY
jgi:hypothetical protein